ncbi:NAD(+) diphosphatase [Ruania zhangjianzhongii]|uniref:NAD(+) diphosphatase n=1 Tax=Ruania zhangjianzhongii TaxID=2603206 RepID=UPI0011CC49FB|nr:NAD(+) diphosphatase [Ruania zhangjianzhongii]
MNSDELPLARLGLDRDTARRVEEGLLDDLAADPATRVLTVRGTQVLADFRTGQPALVTTAAEGTPPASATGAEVLWAYLGVADGRRYLAALEPAAGADEGAEQRWPAGDGSPDLATGGPRAVNLRDIGALLGEIDAGLVTAALALANWHRGHTHCPRCGAVTDVEAAGWVRRCPVDGSQHFPRTDPAVIMAITDPDDRLLIARSAHWPATQYSVPAGFVEPGESLEGAVRREVLEETRVRVGPVQYGASQPWPFPASLMCAFTGRTQDRDPVPDGDEVVDARFVARAEIAQAWAEGVIRPPRPTSVARALIEEWFGRPLPQPE